MPTGESLDVLIRIGAYFAPPLAALGAWGIAKYVRSLHLEKELVDVQKQKADAEGRLAEATRSFDTARDAQLTRYDRLRAAYEEARVKFYRIRKAYLDLRELTPSPGRSSPPEPGLAERLAVVEAERDEARHECDRLQRLVSDGARFDGRLWLREPAAPVPVFRPRAGRKAVIISVLNLKGGVGKTTIAANLAGTLARPDAPVLLMDLDYQRSLSMLLVPDRVRKDLHKAGDTVQHFLAGPRHALVDLTGRVRDLAPDLPHCSVLTNSDNPTGSDAADSLEETETRLMAEWLFDRARPDPRFFLREALHDPGLDYAYVLLDCPPRLTTACVNALAASDFVLIPVVPDAVSTHAVENLLRTLARFRADLLPDLRVLAVVPNMVRLRNGKPIEAQVEALANLRLAVDALSGGDSVPVAQTCVKHDSQFGQSAACLDASGKLRLAIADNEIRQTFASLAHELEDGIRHASRRSTAVPAKPGTRARSSR